MPGAIPHIIAAIIMFYIGKHHYHDYFAGSGRTKEQYLLLGVCMLFTFVPDFPLTFYYIIPLVSFHTILPYHAIFQFILIPISLILILLLSHWEDIKRKPIWITGAWCILLHIIMDAFIPEAGILI